MSSLNLVAEWNLTLHCELCGRMAGQRAVIQFVPFCKFLGLFWTKPSLPACLPACLPASLPCWLAAFLDDPTPGRHRQFVLFATPKVAILFVGPIVECLGLSLSPLALPLALILVISLFPPG